MSSPFFRPQTPLRSNRTPFTLFRTPSLKIRTPSRVSPHIRTPSRVSPHIRTPSRASPHIHSIRHRREFGNLTNIERAVAYGTKRQPALIADNIRKQKTICGKQGLLYNPLLKKCVRSLGKNFKTCREDCARIGKRCGPKGTCIKL
jgi:hypothetical protein